MQVKMINLDELILSEFNVRKNNIEKIDDEDTDIASLTEDIK